MKRKKQITEFYSAEFGSLGILMLEDRPYFPATECATLLGYKNPQKAIRDHCKGVNETFTPSSGGAQKTKYIPEGDLYRLIIRSKLPAAERFEKWVFEEALPTIRKHGAYISYDTLDELLSSPKFANDLIKKLAKEREKNAALQDLAAEMAPKALYCDLILQCKNALPVSVIAKDYGMSAVAFNRLLRCYGIQYKTGCTWLLYQEYAGKGYTQTRTYRISEKTAATHTCWTQKGRLFLYKFLKDYGFLPVIESGAIALY